jgi:uncharacterized membrane protein
MRDDRHATTAAPTLRLGRLVAFSDAVLAIVITLLVLGLNVPSAQKVPEKQLPEYLVDSIPSGLAYITSFLTYWTKSLLIYFLSVLTRCHHANPNRVPVLREPHEGAG